MSENEKIIELLEKQNSYLQTITEIVREEHTEAQIGRIIHALLIIIPAIVILILGFYLWSSVTHYLDIMNNNVNALQSNFNGLKSNFDTITSVFTKFIPNFNTIGSQLQQTWQNLQTWK